MAVHELRCELAAAQCIVIGPVCAILCGFVAVMLTRTWDPRPRPRPRTQVTRSRPRPRPWGIKAQAKAKDLVPKAKAKAKAKDLGPKAKAKDLRCQSQ